MFVVSRLSKVFKLYFIPIPYHSEDFFRCTSCNASWQLTDEARVKLTELKGQTATQTAPQPLAMRAYELSYESAGDVVEFGEAGLAVIRRQLEREFGSAEVERSWSELAPIVKRGAQEGVAR